MTDDEQRNEKSKLLLEWTENKQELARRRASASRLADILGHVAATLRSKPESLVFTNEGTSIKYIDRNTPMLADTTGLDVSTIQKVRDSIRELEDRQELLAPRMQAFNLPL